MPAVQPVNVPDHSCVWWCCPTNKGWRMQMKISKKKWSFKTSINSLQFWQLYNFTGKFSLRLVVSVFTFQSIPSKSPLPCRYGANRPGPWERALPKSPQKKNRSRIWRGGVPGGTRGVQTVLGSGNRLYFFYPNFIREYPRNPRIPNPKRSIFWQNMPMSHNFVWVSQERTWKKPIVFPLEFFQLFNWILNCWCLKKIDFCRETCASKNNK